MQQRQGSNSSWEKPPTLAAQNTSMEIEINKQQHIPTDGRDIIHLLLITKLKALFNCMWNSQWNFIN